MNRTDIDAEIASLKAAIANTDKEAKAIAVQKREKLAGVLARAQLAPEDISAAYPDVKSVSRDPLSNETTITMHSGRKMRVSDEILADANGGLGSVLAAMPGGGGKKTTTEDRDLGRWWPTWSPQDPKRDKEFTQISRGALEDLVDQVPGLTMDWNGGNPYFTRNGEPLGLNNPKEGRWKNVADAASSALSGQIGTVMDRMVKDLLRVNTAAEEEKVKEQLRQTGASDADIAAAEELLRAPGSRLEASKPPLLSTGSRISISGLRLNDLPVADA